MQKSAKAVYLKQFSLVLQRKTTTGTPCQPQPTKEQPEIYHQLKTKHNNTKNTLYS
ncbi:hypothetical protein [Photobacterium salinisoli]|uniref:hypothetical protein n=1 Tax=Photobacterium salinisoli TaxID=1616783 RepID=UPI0013C42DCD|nr:hypothetical protein [Photobacterium salinisoli]